MRDLSLVKRIYFIGIGGIGMSAVAGIAKDRGYEVSGSDSTDIYQPSKGVLDRFDIPYKIGYNVENFPENIDLVVTTSAIDYKNMELQRAVEKLIPVISFAELLSVLVADKKQVVVIGTHGKGTISGLIAYVLKSLEDSGFFVGAVLNNLQTNYHYGKGPNFVIEGDEYKANFNDETPKFAYFNPHLLVINNIEHDHPDMYATLADFKKAFFDFVKKLPETSTVIYNADDENVLDVIKETKAKKVGFGFGGSADIHAEKPVYDQGNFRIKVGNKEKTFTFVTKFPGMPYAYNVLAAVTALIELGHNPKEIAPLIKEYSGVKRRFEIIYDKEITIIDDYAHHPTAVKQTLEATRQKYPGRRIICFFEPHTYSRTKETLASLATSFASADLVYIAEVYPAREQKLPSSITGEEVVMEVKKHQPKEKVDSIHYVSGKGDALEKFNKAVKKDDVCIVMAVGAFNTLVYDLKSSWEQI